MADDPIDPATLQGDALTRWYLRSPDDIERERQSAAAQRYDAFFGNGDIDPGSSRGPELPSHDADPGFTRDSETSTPDVDPAFTWVPAGPNRWRSVRVASDNAPASVTPDGLAANDGAVIDRGLAGPEDGAQLIDIGNPANRQLRRQYEQKYGPWPKTADGRNYDVSHKRAIADGGTNTLENIEPMHPDDHAAMHAASGDGARWGRRAAIARAFGGTVEPSNGGPVARGLGWITAPSDLTGILAGRIRTDSFSHFTTDMLGLPSLEFTDPREAAKLNPAFCPPGGKCV